MSWLYLWAPLISAIFSSFAVATLGTINVKLVRRLFRVERAIGMMHAFRLVEMSNSLRVNDIACPACGGKSAHSEDCLITWANEHIKGAMEEAKKAAGKDEKA